MSAREEALRAETSNLRAQVTASQGPLLQVTIYKLLRTKAFGEYVNACEDAINPLMITDAIELIILDFLELNIKRSDYG